MLTRDEMKLSKTLDIDWNQDRIHGVSNDVGRAVFDGKRAVVVGQDAPAKTQIAALMDLLDLHQSNAVTSDAVVQDEVSVLLGGPADEARGALETLICSMVSGPRVSIFEHVKGDWQPVAPSGWNIGDGSSYERWPGLLRDVSAPPGLVDTLVAKVGLDQFRAYPMLSLEGRWSLRLEGLEVARVSASGGTLRVGKDGAAGAQSAARRAWVSSTGSAEAITLDESAGSLDRAARSITKFAQAWANQAGDVEVVPVQNEHALESRILRGVAPVDVRGRALQLIRPDDGVVNWGSQFPTKWGEGGSRRYLDALLRDGDVPWAIEMKVQGSGGVGKYYRHAVAQAVLYREFIKKAKDLHFWFEAQQLDPGLCEAAVVIPMIPAKQGMWREKLVVLCHSFDVALVELDPRFAHLSAAELSEITPRVD